MLGKQVGLDGSKIELMDLTVAFILLFFPCSQCCSFDDISRQNEPREDTKSVPAEVYEGRFRIP